MKKIDLNIKNTEIPLLYEFDNSLPVVNFKLIFKFGGSMADKKSGCAKILANMLNEGTLSLGNKFNKMLEIRAIDLNISANFESFIIQINSLKEHFSYALEMLEILLKEPNFTDEILDKIKIQTKGEIASLENEYDYLANLALKEIIHPNTPLSRASIGTFDSVESINLDDIKGFFNSNLTLSNLIVLLGGDVKNSFKFDNLFSNLKVGEKKEQPFFITSDKKNIKRVTKPSEQAFIYFASPYNVEKEEYFKAKAATFILGSAGFGTRLMEEIRVKQGLAYSIYARAVFSLTSKKLSGYMQTKNENQDRAIEIIKDEYAKFVKNGVTKKELEQAKNFLLGSVVLQKETFFQRLSIKENEFYSGFEFGEFERNLKRLEELSLDELNSFIKEHSEIENLSFAILSNV